jgi:hypothetical protein
MTTTTRNVSDLRKELVANGVANCGKTNKSDCLDLLSDLGVMPIENTQIAYHEIGVKLDHDMRSTYGDMARLIRRLTVVAVTEGEEDLRLAIMAVLSGMTNETAGALRKAINNSDGYFSERNLEVTIKMRAMPKDGSYTVDSWALAVPELAVKNGFKVIATMALPAPVAVATDTDGDTVEPATDGDTVEPATDGDTVEPATDGDAATVDTDGKVIADTSPAGQEQADIAREIEKSANVVAYVTNAIDFLSDSDMEKIVDNLTIELERRAAKVAENATG